MTMRPLVYLILLTASALLASCSGTLTCGNSHPYASNVARPPLTAPAGVTVPAPDAAYLVPAGSTKSTAAPAASTAPLAQPCLVTPPNVLTPADIAAPPKAEAPKKPTVPIGTHPTSSGNAPPAEGLPPPPVAGRGSME